MSQKKTHKFLIDIYIYIYICYIIVYLYVNAKKDGKTKDQRIVSSDTSQDIRTDEGHSKNSHNKTIDNIFNLACHQSGL